MILPPLPLFRKLLRMFQKLCSKDTTQGRNLLINVAWKVQVWKERRGVREQGPEWMKSGMV